MDDLALNYQSDFNSILQMIADARRKALDRDVKKPHENPSVGIILCKSKDARMLLNMP